MAKKEIATDTQLMPRHIGFIMDGNGRWAKKRGMPREYGHRFGAETFRRVMEYCGDIGIEAATFYVFSTENWKRPQKEVDSIMKLLNKYLDECEERVMKNNVRFVFLGDKGVFPEDMRAKMIDIEEKSKNNKSIINLALNYGGRDEIAMAVNKLISEGKTHVSEADISAAVYTSASPELDLVIRTGGDMRISNFLLWQSAYAELYFTDTLWPDFSTADVDAAINNFMSRKRRFGGV